MPRSLTPAEHKAWITRVLAPLVTDLLAAQVRLNSERSIRFLYEEDYPIGLPILLDHLRHPYDDAAKAVIATGLYYSKNRYSKQAWPEIAELYSTTENKVDPGTGATARPSRAKAALANALLRLYDPKRLDALVALIRDAGNGETRVILLEPLLRVKNRRPEVWEILMDLKQDPELNVELSARGVV